MSGVKTCPLCGIQLWKSDNKAVLEIEKMDKFQYCGYSIRQIDSALTYAMSHGWKPS